MSNELPKLSEANYEIMEVIWELGEATVTEVLNEINSRRGRKIHRNSVLVQLSRLSGYGWLNIRKSGKTFYYSASTGRDAARRDIVQDINQRIFNGSKAEMIRYLFEEQEINNEEFNELEKMIDRFEGEKA